MITDVAKLAAIPRSETKPDAHIREVAEQFEAVLLTQLTSVLAGNNEEGDEEKLFGNDGGSGLAKQMFAEQMAQTMAKSGGVGLADMLVAKMTGDAAPKSTKGAPSAPSKAMKEIIRDAGGTKPERMPTEAVPVREKRSPVLNIDRPSPLMPEAAPVSVSLSMPANGRISSGFGTRFHPIDKRAKFHGGIDIAIPKGTPVRAAADGVVEFAGWKGGYGYAVVIRHADGSETLYGHNEKLLVEEGQPVSAGQQITLSGSTGKSTGPHLHFEVRENGKLVDPAKLLSNVFPNRSR